jgi:hypothetical protein
VAALALAVTSSRVTAQFDDEQVKAAFVLNFLKFVTWPAEGADATVDLVVIGDDALARVLEQAAARQQIGGRPIVVRAAPRRARSARRPSCSTSAPRRRTASPCCCGSAKASRC